MVYFKSEGSIQKICADFANINIEDTENAEAILEFLLENKGMIDDQESIIRTSKFPEPPPGVMSFTTPEYNYYINVKLTTIVIAAFILDIVLTKGALATLLNMCGFSSTCITKLDEKSGEKCIVKETLLNAEKVGGQDILARFSGECCNNDMNCKFRSDYHCKCTRNDIIAIYQKLSEKNVFKRVGDHFEYQW